MSSSFSSSPYTQSSPSSKESNSLEKVEAHAFARQAESLVSQGNLKQAADAHLEAAENFLIAFGYTSDPEAGKTLKLLYTNHTRQAKDLQKRLKRQTLESSIHSKSNQTSSNINNSNSYYGHHQNTNLTNSTSHAPPTSSSSRIMLPPNHQSDRYRHPPTTSIHGGTSGFSQNQQQQQSYYSSPMTTHYYNTSRQQSSIQHVHRQTQSSTLPHPKPTPPLSSFQAPNHHSQQQQPISTNTTISNIHSYTLNDSAAHIGASRNYFIGQTVSDSATFSSIHLPQSTFHPHPRPTTAPLSYASSHHQKHPYHQRISDTATLQAVSLDHSTSNTSEYDDRSYFMLQESQALANSQNPDDPFVKFWDVVENLVQRISLPAAVAYASLPQDSNITLQKHNNNSSSNLSSHKGSSSYAKNCHQDEVNPTMLESTAILNSYFVVPSKNTPAMGTFNHQTTANFGGGFDTNSQTTKLMEKSKSKTFEEYQIENEQLKRTLDEFTRKTTHIDKVHQENHMLKSSIMQFRNDFQKQFNRYQMTNSVILKKDPLQMDASVQTEKWTSENESMNSKNEGKDALIAQLETELTNLKIEYEKEYLTAKKYKERWDKIKDTARKKKAGSISENDPALSVKDHFAIEPNADVSVTMHGSDRNMVQERHTQDFVIEASHSIIAGITQSEDTSVEVAEVNSILINKNLTSRLPRDKRTLSVTGTTNKTVERKRTEIGNDTDGSELNKQERSKQKVIVASPTLMEASTMIESILPSESILSIAEQSPSEPKDSFQHDQHEIKEPHSVSPVDSTPQTSQTSSHYDRSILGSSGERDLQQQTHSGNSMMPGWFPTFDQS